MQGGLVFVDHAHFQCGGAADDVFGFGGVLYAGELDGDAVGTGLLDDGLGHAQFVDAVVQGGDVLFDGLFADVGQCLFGQGEDEAAAVGGEGGFGQQALQLRQHVFQLGGVLERDGEAVVVDYGLAAADFLFGQLAADVAGVTLEGFLHGGLHVHLHGEVHAAAQIEAEEHRVGADFRHPVGGVGDLVEGGDVAFAQRAFDDRTRLHLGLRVFEAHFERAVGDKHAVVGDAGRFQGLGDARFGLAVNRERMAVGRNLYRQRVAEEVGQGVEQAEREHGGNQQVFPQGVAVHNQTFKGQAACAARFSDGLWRLFGVAGGNGVAFHLDFHVAGDFHGEEFFAGFGDFAGDAGGEQHFVARFELGEQVLVFFKLLLLRAHDEQVEKHQNQGEGGILHQRGGLLGGIGGEG